ncbi:MAG: IPT/TIG domain-containing protein [Acidobacteriota bacterium]
MAVFITTSLILPFSGKASFTSKANLAAPPVSTVVPPFQSSSSFDKLLQDDSSGDMLRWNAATGEYLFSRCSNGFTLIGTGTVSSKGSTYTLTHNATDRRVQATLDAIQHSGTASIQYPIGTTFTITDRSTTPDPGASDMTPPQVNVTAPNGSELVDTGSHFTITWEATDNIAVTKQDVLLSTDGGNSFAVIAQNLASDVNQYDWIAPLISTNQNVRVRVVAYDAACNVSRDESDANFTIVSTNTTFTHFADTPVYMLGGGFNSVIHLCNTSPDSVIVELGVRNRFGTGLVSPPSQFTVPSGQVRAINLADYLTPTTPPTTGDPNVLMGSIRLRHNGSQDNAVRAIVAVDRNNEDESFTVPFVYVNSQQSPNSTMQCAPLYYIDEQTNANLSLQNVTNSPVSVSATLHYGTGETGTPNGTYALPYFTLPPQGSALIDLAQFADKLQGTHWGSITLNTPPQSVVAHTVMMSSTNSLAFDSNFVDPMMCASATKTVSTLKLDYAMNLQSCLMVCNTSSADTRSVTINFQTDNGVTLPSQTLSLAPGQQRLIELDSRQLLQPNTGTMATAQVSYEGNASDIIASAVSMSAANSCAIPAQFTEPHASDSRRLVAPFFRFDERTSGILQVSNFGATAIKAGAGMKFADTTLPMLNTDLITVPAGGTATIDLQSYFYLVDDGVAARGCVELIHNGAPGSVTATFTAIGKHNNLSLEVPLESGPAFNATDMALFPNSADVQPSDSKEVAVLTGGSLNAPNWSVNASIGDPGSITPLGSSDSNVYRASYTAPADTKALNVTVNASASGGGTQSGNFSLSKVGVTSFSSALGNGRLNPKANTNFTITGNQDFPEGSLVVVFRQGDKNTPDIIVSRSVSDSKILTGIAPPNTSFIGDAQIIILQNGTKISKDKTKGAAYYAFNPPSPPTATSPDGFNRLGGILTITSTLIDGNGFETFNQLKPSVNIGGLDFTVNTSQPTRLDGLVLRASKDISSCTVEGQTPCKRITVLNPGGRKADKTISNIPLYNLKPGPTPAIQSINTNVAPSTGQTQVRISGTNLDFVKRVTFSAVEALEIVRQTPDQLRVIVPPNCRGTSTITIFDVDDGSAALAGFQYVAAVPQQVNSHEIPGLGYVFIVGGCSEALSRDNNFTFTPNCIAANPPHTAVQVNIQEILQPDPRLPSFLPGQRVFAVNADFNRGNCPGNLAVPADFDLTLFNSADTTKRLTVRLRFTRF